jgi:hypothetical protein
MISFRYQMPATAEVGEPFRTRVENWVEKFRPRNLLETGRAVGANGRDKALQTFDVLACVVFVGAEVDQRLWPVTCNAAHQAPVPRQLIEAALSDIFLSPVDPTRIQVGIPALAVRRALCRSRFGISLR